MKIYIVTDLEGPASVNMWVQTREGATPENLAAKHLLTAETNAAIDGILDAEPDCEITVLDGHGSGGLIYELLHPRARYIMHGVLDTGYNSLFANAASYDALMFVGQHAMAGTPAAPLCHTYSSLYIEYYKLNGQFIGETGYVAAKFGYHDVPAIFLSGDDKACIEAKSHVPNIVTVATKEGLGVQFALHLSAEAARHQIRGGATEAIRRINEIPPFKIDGPCTLEVRVLEGADIQGWLKSGKYEKVDDRTVVQHAKNVRGLDH
jgi:D-amino peptidase